MDLSLISNAIVSNVVQYAAAHAGVAAVLSVLYIAGLVFKVARTAIEAYVKESPSKDDDLKLDAVEKSMAAKVVFFFMDLLIRFKKTN
jgi:hypothetical protein